MMKRYTLFVRDDFLKISTLDTFDVKGLLL